MTDLGFRCPRLGLCCLFFRQPIRFRIRQAVHLRGCGRIDALRQLADTCRANAIALLAALEYCREHDIGCFRVNSRILPLKTHPELGYAMEDLPAAGELLTLFRRCGEFARRHDIRLTLHPDQFVLLSSPSDKVTAASLAELLYQNEVAEWIGADVINIHAGGVYGDKSAALARLRRQVDGLPPDLRGRLSLENDDRLYAVAELLPLCRDLGLPLAYDVHHHRCLPDGLSVEEASVAAAATWNREPLFHLSSPGEGWQGKNSRHHHEFIDPADFPLCWLGRRLTVEVEAKAKELAVERLQAWLTPQGRTGSTGRVGPCWAEKGC
ncbi:MAG: UV damage repair endonuclease UvsE [Desulfobulbaceae bacterium A2]|nr:MAG: UV damage repair endonuclease UvsE [Desulfobulbaceae bacterium A2]